MLNNENSKWIWFENNPKAKDQMAYIRKEIVCGGKIDQITIFITASNRYKVFIDGNLLGIGPCPGDPKLYYYDTYSIDSSKANDTTITSKSLENNSFCLSAVCYNIGETVEIITGQNKGQAGFRCLIEIKGQDKDGFDFSRLIGSDESFKAISAPTKPGDFVMLDESRISKWSGFKEIFDARCEPAGWNLPGFDDSSWNDAVIAQGATDQFASLFPREIPFMTDYSVFPKEIVQIENYKGKIKFEEHLVVSCKSFKSHPSSYDAGNSSIDSLKKPILSTESQFSVEQPVIIDAGIPGAFPAIVLDFGKEVVGYPSYTIRGMSGANVSFWYGESLDLYRYDTVILNGEKITYQPYQIRAFRYLKIVFNNSITPIELFEVKLRMWRYPYEEKGAFLSSDPLLNQIWQTSTYTVKMNSLEHFVDCPLREQAQWLADSRVMAMSQYWVFNAPDLVRKTIRQFLAVQTEDGFIFATGPQQCTITNMDFPCHLFMMVYEYYFYTEDMDFMREIYGKLGTLLAFYESIEDEDGFIIDKNQKGYFLDWAFIDKRDQVTAAQCLYYQAIVSYAKISDLLGDSRTAERQNEKAKHLRGKINALLYDESKGLYCDCRVDGIFSPHYSQQSTAYALIMGVAKEESRADLIEKMYSVEGIEQIKGAFLLSFVTAMLFEDGFGDKSISTIRDYWGEMIKRGATTWWETFDRQSPFTTIPYCFAGNSPTYLIEYIPTSHCHAWGSGPAYTLPSFILGIIPVEAGFRKIKIQPVACDLDWCEGSVPTKYGLIRVKWIKNIDGQIDYEIKEKPREVEIVEISDQVRIRA